jgi:hypothetical protein
MAYSVMVCLFKTRFVDIGGGHLSPVSATTNWITLFVIIFHNVSDLTYWTLWTDYYEHKAYCYFINPQMQVF